MGVLSFIIVFHSVTYSLFFAFYRSRKDSDRTEKVIGRVERYTKIQYNGVSLPIVSYQVKGQSYKVVGPKFRYTRNQTFSCPVHAIDSKVDSNLVTRENLPEVLDIWMESNGLASITKSSLLDLCPKGISADVFYKPNQPNQAYDQRPLVRKLT